MKTWGLKRDGKLTYIQDCDLRRPWKTPPMPLRHEGGKPVRVIVKI